MGSRGVTGPLIFFFVCVGSQAALDVDRAVQIEARRQQRLRAEQQRLVAGTNARLAETQRSEATRRTAEFTSNTPTAAFFDQFNRSTR